MEDPEDLSPHFFHSAASGSQIFQLGDEKGEVGPDTDHVYDRLGTVQ